MVEKTGNVRFAPGSRLAEIYGRSSSTEGYHCSYGFNPVYRSAFERAGLRFSAFDDAGEIRAAELPMSLHPFFIGTLFQSERAALRGEIPPLVRAFIQATLSRP
jgi:CTP synthase (UTP-ammonia lyase)